MIQTDWAQNIIIRQVTQKLSKNLKTTVKIDHVSIDFFNRLNLNGALILDQNKDTMLYAGSVKVRITDWFFFKDQAELEYLGLENAYIQLQRKDSTWNYAFLEKAFSTSTTSKKQNQIQFHIKDIDLKNIRLAYKDGWIGENILGSIGSLELRAHDINLTKKQIDIRYVSLDRPSFSLIDYTGNRPDSMAPSKTLKPFKPGVLKWNPEGWSMNIDKVKLNEGAFYFQADTKKLILPYFDPNHIQFTRITGSIDNLTFQQDTLAGKIELKTNERSGFTISSLKADWSFDPDAMTFKQLALSTPYSSIGDTYIMRYDRFRKDMRDFISKVTLELSLKNSLIHTRDIAFFAPELDGWNKKFNINGEAKGTVDNFKTENLYVRYGTNTVLKGDLSMKGLPDINNTFISFTKSDLSTTYKDALSFYPELAKIKKPDLTKISYLKFNGDISGKINAFTTKGKLSTEFGQVYADARFVMPERGRASYSGMVNISNFNLGKLLDAPQIDLVSFNGKISGNGFDKNADIYLNGTVPRFDFNHYAYQHIHIDGKLHSNEFTGKLNVDDPNLKMYVNGLVNMKNPEKPTINVETEISNASLKALQFSNQDIQFTGKGRFNLAGKTIDDLIGEATLYDLALKKNDETFTVDSLSLSSMNIDGHKRIEVKNNDLSAVLDGKFTLSTLGTNISNYLFKYYPSYFKYDNRPLPVQDFTFKVDFENIEQYLRLFNEKITGFNYSSLESEFHTEKQIFKLNASIPLAEFGKYRIEDFRFRGNADLDSLRFHAAAGTIIINDSLQLPNTSLDILALGDISDISINTGGNQKLNAANLSAQIQHLSDGLSIQFKPSSIVINEKTWKIDKGGELTITKSVVDASEIKIYNGEQQLLISSIPSEIGNSHDIIIELQKVNLGDLLPYVVQEPRIQGITSGEITIEDPLNKFKVYINAQTDQTRFENDSIGITTLNGYYDKQLKKISFNMQSENPGYTFLIDGKVNISDSSKPIIDASIDLDETKISVLETYLEAIFSKMDGYASGKINIQGDANSPDLIGTVKLKNVGIEIDFTKVYYKLNDTEIEFKSGELDLGTIQITDPLGNTGSVSGKLKHQFFKEMEYDFKATSPKILAINTTRKDNNLFHGKAIARVGFSFSGNEQNMKMYINGAAVDSSNITIETTASTKQTGEVDYIKWRQYGREMNTDSLKRENSNLSMDFDLVASPILKMTVVLDPLTGDSITATGSGNLKILTGTNEALTLNGRYNIESGVYNFNFQDIFNKPFYIEQNSGSYLSWTGDPYNAEININTKYIAEKVRMSTLFDAGNATGISTANSDVMREISDIWVMCTLTGTLNSPNTSFQLLLPPTSAVKNNPTIENKLKTINRDQNEVSKQSTYLIVFKSFAPEAAIVTTNLNLELLSNTISGVINSILSNSVQNFFYKLFGSSVDVNFNYSRVATNLGGTPTSSSTQNQNTRENVSLEFIKSLVNNRLILTFGSDFNFNAVGNTVVTNQNFLFLPDVNVEYKITPDGKLRTSFFYRSSFDVLSSSGRRERTGGNLSFRTEFDHLFRRKNKN